MCIIFYFLLIGKADDTAFIRFSFNSLLVSRNFKMHKATFRVGVKGYINIAVFSDVMAMTHTRPNWRATHA